MRATSDWVVGVSLGGHPGFDSPNFRKRVANATGAPTERRPYNYYDQIWFDSHPKRNYLSPILCSPACRCEAITELT